MPTARTALQSERIRLYLRIGEVIAGDGGEVRRAIVYHGDVMNTAAPGASSSGDDAARLLLQRLRDRQPE